MRVCGLPLSILISLAAPLLAVAQDQNSNSSSSSNSSSTYAQDCVSALQAAGFTQLAETLTKINETEQGQALFSELSSGRNYTVFAPNDAAFQNVSSDITGNSSLLAELISYHFVNGDFTNTSYTNTSSSGGGGAATSSATTTETQSTTETSTQTSSSESTSTDTSTATETATATVGSAAIFERLFGRQDQSNSSTDNPQPFSGVYPNVTIGRTLLNASSLVNLEGNKSQVLVWTRSGQDGNVTIWNQAQNITVTNGTRWNNLFINGITGVLIPPGNLSTALTAVDANAARNLLSNVQLSSGSNSSQSGGGGGSTETSTMTESATSTDTTTASATETSSSTAALFARQDQGGNGTEGDNGGGDGSMNMTALEVLQNAKGITVFVPNDNSFTSDVNQTLAGLQGDSDAQANILANHYINGTSLYSTQITNDTRIVTAGGEDMSFSTNDTGLFVTVGNNTAQITRPDVLLDNGVAHVINRVLVSQDDNEDVAASAYQSATSQAAISTTETAPIGVGAGGSMPTSTDSSSQSSMSSTESSSQSSMSSSSESSSQSTSTATSTATETQSATQSAFVLRGMKMGNGAVISTNNGIFASVVTSIVAGVFFVAF